ncbi:hypothetical protein KZX06_09705 [Micrococcus sp. EYE_162]|uniref:hypothetical protein n=1 Tax=unclassified Micrococcus TaxID=2620948 RepID=UPI0020042487|nr:MULTISPECIES: hypothetical protein [unclassified Micrococcus]MCK6096201.1 hypothetical protein [Micrococcus sp. EYE_212]MCK6172292.1 hypothetical protein [Micrococcus sp. EYE_162]
MKIISFHTTFAFHGPQDRDWLDQQTDALADALVDMEGTPGHAGLRDSSVSVDFARCMVEVDLTVEHAGLEEGAALAQSCLNRALTRISNGPEMDRETTAQHADLVAV